MIIFLLWLWIANLTLLFGAEFDAELERGRQLQAGIAAEEDIRLPPRDTKRRDTAKATEQKDADDGRRIREQAGQMNPGHPDRNARGTQDADGGLTAIRGQRHDDGSTSSAFSAGTTEPSTTPTGEYPALRRAATVRIMRPYSPARKRPLPRRGRMLGTAVLVIGACALVGIVPAKAAVVPSLPTLTSPVAPATPPADDWKAAWTTPVAQIAQIAGQSTTLTCRSSIVSGTTGTSVRVRVSNLYVYATTQFGEVTIAERTATGGIDPSKTVTLTVDGSKSFSIGGNSEVTTDAVDFAMTRGGRYEVSVYATGPTLQLPGHPYNMTQTFCGNINSGNLSRQASPLPQSNPTIAWVTGVDVSSPSTKVVVAVGDSITEGFGSTFNGYRRWTDTLQKALSEDYSVVNGGIATNTVTDTTSLSFNAEGGTSMGERLDRDALKIPGASVLIISGGSNDICAGVPANSVISGLQSIADRAHAAGLRVLSTTIIPRGGANCGGVSDADFRTRADIINGWIRTTTSIDAFADFSSAVQNTDPDYFPGRTTGAPFADYANALGRAYDSGDHAHPSDAGYAALAAVISPTMITGR